MAEQLFDLGFNGVTQTMGHEEDGVIVLSEVMPAGSVQAILDANHADALAAKRRLQTSDLGVIGARIPITLHTAWRNEWRLQRDWGVPWHVFLKKKLNSSENAKFRFMKL